jgi:hypothetical protein
MLKICIFSFQYTLQLVEYSNDDSGYANDMMKYVLPGINELAANAVNYDAMENLLLWMVSYFGIFICGISQFMSLCMCV